MQSKWRGCTLGDVLELQRGFDLPVQDRRPGHVPVVASTGVIGRHDSAQVKGPGVVIGRSGSIGGGQYLSGDFWPLNTTLWVKDFKGNLPRYCYYLLRSIDFSKFNAGSGVPTLNRNHVHPLPVALAPQAEQHAIAGLLGGLDDRIDLLRHTNTTLESIAQALFKSWFIDFDPVRAKAEGREPEGMDAATAALFPAEFEDSALGSIPKGWEVGVVEDLLILQRGFDLPATQRIDGEFPVVAASGPSGTHHEAMVKGPGVTTGRSGVIGNVYFVHDDYWPLNTSLWVKEFKVATPEYAYQFLETLNLKRLNAGSAVPTLNRNHVHAQPTLVPTSSVVAAYTDLASALLRRVKTNELHAESLTAVRDSLLPRLISGKLRLPEAQEQLEDALA